MTVYEARTVGGGDGGGIDEEGVVIGENGVGTNGGGGGNWGWTTSGIHLREAGGGDADCAVVTEEGGGRADGLRWRETRWKRLCRRRL